MLKSLLFSFALVVFFSLRLQAQESQWTEVSYTLEVQSNQSVEQVRDELLKIARQKAVEKVSGFNVSTASLSNDSWESTEGDNNFFQSFKVLSNISSQGLIVEEQSPKYESLASGEQKITYKAKVAKSTAEIDPNFNLTVELNKTTFRISEFLDISVKSSQDAYLTIFAIYENEKAGIVFPNSYMKDNALKGFEARAIPSNEDKQRGIKFEMQASPSGEKRYSEVLLFVATKEPGLFQKLNDDVNYDITWLDVNQWLMKIPADQKTVAYSQYQVIEN